MTTLLNPGWQALRRHRRAFVWMLVAFYGLFAFSLIAAMLDHDVKAIATSWYDIRNIEHPLLDYTYAGYAHGALLQAALGTFTVNMIVAALAIVPSLIVPFSGIPYVYVRGFLWGAMFAPFGWERVIMPAHMPTVIVEGFAYLLAAFAAYVIGVKVRDPRRYGFASRGEAYRAALPEVGALSLVVTMILGLAALYEAFEVIHLVPALAARAAAG